MVAIDQLSTLLLPAAWIWFAALMLLRTVVALRRGYKLELGSPKGDPRRGVLYSLTFSMLPWRKDSTRRHPWTYAAGMGMHLGVLAAVLFALGRRFGWLPEGVAPVLGGLCAVGVVSALGLLIKRSSQSYMRSISSLDDFVANFAVELYLVGAMLTAFSAQFVGLWRLAVVFLLIYAPLGKIYHMLLFFVSRTLFGLQFGRRGVLRHGLPISY